MTRTVNIEVFCDRGPNGGKDIFGVASEHRSDLPDPFDTQLQQWVGENFDYLNIGDTVLEAADMVYEPNGEIIEFQKKE